MTTTVVNDFIQEYTLLRIKPNADCHDRLIVLDYGESTEQAYHCGLLVRIEIVKSNQKADRKERILFIKNIFRLVYTAIYLTAIMIEIIRDSKDNNTYDLVMKGVLFLWITLLGTRCFWIHKIAKYIKGKIK